MGFFLRDLGEPFREVLIDWPSLTVGLVFDGVAAFLPIYPPVATPTTWNFSTYLGIGTVPTIAVLVLTGLGVTAFGVSGRARSSGVYIRPLIIGSFTTLAIAAVSWNYSSSIPLSFPKSAQDFQTIADLPLVSMIVPAVIVVFTVFFPPKNKGLVVPTGTKKVS